MKRTRVQYKRRSERSVCTGFRTNLRVGQLCCAIGIVATTACTAPFARGDPRPSNDPLVQIVDLGVLEQHVTRASLLPTLPDPQDFGLQRIDAFEENLNFIYLSGVLRKKGGATPGTVNSFEPVSERRVFILKPSILVIDDRLASQNAAVVWKVRAQFPLAAQEKTIRSKSYDGRFRCRCMLPDAVTWIVSNESDREGSASHLVAASAKEGDGSVRIVHVMSFGGAWRAALPDSSVEQDGSRLRLKLVSWDELTDRNRVVHLTLAEDAASNKVKIVGEDGYMEVDKRLLPAGILPPGERGVQLQQQWDLPYRSKEWATWDTGRPSSELKRIVENGTIKPCRTVEFGCGTGNDAIYLASKGFDVTAIDISPTALSIAERKAKEANVKVHWLLADVLKPPQLDAFDFVYDRGCYHEVRRNFAKEYVAAVRRVTHSGSRTLILAGNANKDSYWRFHGPPRVKEKEIRGDFATGFRILRLKEFRFDPAPPDRSGALAWSVLLERE